MLPGLLTVGIFLSLILLISNFRRTPSALFLGGFFFLVSLHGFIHYVLLFSKTVWLIAIVFINVGFLTYLIGPMLYWYVRSLLTDDARFKKSDLLHFIPMLLYLAGTFSYIITPWSYKMDVAHQLADNLDNMREFKNVGIYRLFPMGYVFLSRPLLALGYAFWSAYLFFLFISGKKQTGVFPGQRFMIRWMLMLLGFLTILAFSQLLLLMRAFQDGNSLLFYTLNSLQLISGIGLAGLLISPFFFPAVLYGLPRIPDNQLLHQEQFMSETPAYQLVKNKTKIRFEKDYLEQISNNAEKCMQELRPYLQPEFNLAQLSVMIRVPAHHLAYYFREVKKQTFSDFRNQWRVEHAKNLIREGKSSELTLEAIGLLSGFSSRNTFLHAFKKVEGISPQSFLAKIKTE